MVRVALRGAAVNTRQRSSQSGLGRRSTHLFRGRGARISMLSRIRSLWLASGGVLALTLALSGVVAAGAILSALAAPAAPTTSVPAAAFVDANGNGIADACEAAGVVPDP